MYDFRIKWFKIKIIALQYVAVELKQEAAHKKMKERFASRHPLIPCVFYTIDNVVFLILGLVFP